MSLEQLKVQVEYIKDILNRTTSGPWYSYYPNFEEVRTEDEKLIADFDVFPGEIEQVTADANALFCARARTDVPILIDAVLSFIEFKQNIKTLLNNRDTKFNYNNSDFSRSNEEAHAWAGGCEYVLNKLEEIYKQNNYE